MPVLRRLGFSDAICFLIVLFAAGGARAWYLLTCCDGANSAGPLLVQDPEPVLTALPAGVVLGEKSPPTEQDALVHNLREHHWFGTLAPLASQEEKTAHVAPGYPWLLAWMERSPVSFGPPDWTARWVQCGLGTLTAVLYFFFTLRAFDSRLVATLSGILCAFNPFWIINTAQIDDGVVATFLLALCITFGASAGRSGGPVSGIVYGLGLAGLALVRAALLPFGIVALVWLLLRCRGLRRGWLCGLLAFLGFANGLSLWMFRNYKLFHDVVPVVDSSFYHLWIGNNPRATGGLLSEETVLESLAEARGQDKKAVVDELGQLNQRKRYQELGRDVKREIQRDPAGFFRHRLEAGVCFFFGEQWLRSRLLWQQTRPEAPMPDWVAESYRAILYGSLVFMLLLGALGWRWSYGWHFAAMPSSLAVIWIPLPYIFSHAEFLSGPRLPLDGVFICYAAFALACLAWPSSTALLSGADRRGNPN